ncbi:MAG: hypothetical protein KatS3mg102_1807 [Planctomycetota bacterium]|nr:MAG: hypothetical protein KatS3mg102_1807 [Planctomycetota bacterium]
MRPGAEPRPARAGADPGPPAGPVQPPASAPPQEDPGPEELGRLKRRLLLVFLLAIGLPAALLVYGTLRAIEADRATLAELRREGLVALGRQAAAAVENEARERTAGALEALGPRAIAAAAAELLEPRAGHRPGLAQMAAQLEAAVAEQPLLRVAFVLGPSLERLYPPPSGRGGLRAAAAAPATAPVEPAPAAMSTAAGREAAGPPTGQAVRRLQARARIVAELARARALASRGEREAARMALAELVNDPDDPEGAAWARLELAEALAADGELQAALAQLDLLARLPTELRDPDGVPVAVAARLRAAELRLQAGRVAAGLEELLGLWEQLLQEGVADAADAAGPLAAVVARVRALLAAELGPRGRHATGEPQLLTRYVALEAEAWRRRAQALRVQELERLLPDVVAALRAAPPPPGSIAHFTSQSAAGPRLIACARVAAGPPPQLPYAVGAEIDLERLLAEVATPLLERLGRERQAWFEIVERRRGAVAQGGTPPGGLAPGEPRSGGGAGGLSERSRGAGAVEVPFETLLPFWTLRVVPAATPGWGPELRLGLQLGLLVLLVATMTIGALWALRAAHRSIELAALKSEFVANVSHELRTPLAAIRMYAEMLRRLPPDAAERRARYLDTVLRESERLDNLIQDILEFARLEGERREYSFRRCEPAALVERCLDALEPRLEAEGAQVELQLEEGLPAVWCDEELLQAAVRNLVTNAVKYSPPDRRQIEVVVQADGTAAETAQTPGEVTIAVRDRGVGIPAEERARLFDRFYRGAAARELGVPGSGLGLALVHRVVTDHGGTIEVESVPGEGSIFTIRLPAAGPEPPRPATARGQGER